MADEKGLTVLLKVDTGASPTEFGTVEGQTSGTFNGDVNFADSTAKDNSGWSTQVATTRSGSVTVEGNLRASGSRTNFDILKAAWLAGTSEECQLIYDAAGNGFQGTFYVSMQITGDVNDVAKYTITLAPADALTAVTP